MKKINKLHKYVIYEIFPKSFKDSNNDGVGDLQGIISKIDYFHWLGIDYIWLTPINKSPQIDGGYDVSDYYAIHEEFGTIEDLEILIKEAAKRNIGIIFDIVINHTSNKHEWFKKALAGDEKYQEYYFFRKGKEKGIPPNNWQAIFGGSAWEYVPHLDKWYLHIFAPEQPDLNWNNEDVRQEMADMTSYWIEKGIKGFRVDAIIHIGKTDMEDANPESFAKALGRSPDEFDPENDYTATWYKYSNQPNFISLFTDYKKRIKRKDEVLWVGESSSASFEIYKKLTNPINGIVDFSCIFHHTGLHKTVPKWWRTMEVNDKAFYEVFKSWQEFLDKEDLTICVNFCSHDHARIVNCYGDAKKYRLESSKALGGFIHFLRGVPFIYFGEELGLPNHPFTSIHQLDDVRTVGDYNDKLRWLSEEEAIVAAIADSRDTARTPMPWEPKEDLGWGANNPWLPYDPGNKLLCVEKQYYDTDSTLHFFRKLIQLRKQMRIIQEGTITFHRTYAERVYLYQRKLGGQVLHVYTSLSKKIQHLQEPIPKGTVVINNYKTFNKNLLKPFQFVVIQTWHV